MFLINLAQDVLSQVFGLIGPHEIGRLWLCGSLRLIWLLSEGQALRQFDFEFDPRFRRSSPFLVSHLSSLHHLSINYDSGKGDIWDNATQMPLLPRNLRFLELHQNLALFDFNAQIDDPSRFSQLHTLVLHQLSGYYGLQELDLRPLKLLKTLKIVEPHPSRNPFLLTCLPAHLVDLSLWQLTITREWISSLPASLTRLELRSNTSEAFFDLLPRNLLELSLHVRSPGDEDHQCHALPRGLTSLDLTCFSSVTPLMISELPHTITSVSMIVTESVSDGHLLALWSEMPPTLKQMGKWFWPSNLTKPLAMALPRSLCQSIPCCVLMDAISYLPKGIEGLKERNWNLSLKIPRITYPPHLLSLHHLQISETILSALPPTLTHLERISIREQMTKEMARLFPKKLRYLRISTNNQTQSADSWIELPRTLDFLELHDKRSIDVLKDTKIAKERANDLPPFLRELKLLGASLCPDFYFHLPRTLTSLTIAVQDLPLTSYDAFSTFPVLSTLSISSADSPTSWRHIISSMPRTITSFTWDLLATEGPRKTDLTTHDLMLIPRGLLRLFLPESPHLEPIVAESKLHPFSFVQLVVLGGLFFNPGELILLPPEP